MANRALSQPTARTLSDDNDEIRDLTTNTSKDLGDFAGRSLSDAIKRNVSDITKRDLSTFTGRGLSEASKRDLSDIQQEDWR